MIQTYKIMNGIDRMDSSIFFELSAQHQSLEVTIRRLSKNMPGWEVRSQFSTAESCERLELAPS